MTRSRASAKSAGTRFETAIVAYLAEHVDDRIERRARNGSHDRGDVSGVRTFRGGRVVIEAKDTARVNLGTWMAEAHAEMGNDDAIVGLVVHKRHGKGDPAEQWVTCTVRDLVGLLTGELPPERDPGIQAQASQMPRQAPDSPTVSLSATPPIPTPQTR